MKIIKTEFELKAWAEEVAETIMIRGECGNDITRPTSSIERDIIFKLAYSALLAMNLGISDSDNSDSDNSEARAIIDAAEYAVCQFIKDCNGYYTIFRPLSNIWLNKWENKKEDV